MPPAGNGYGGSGYGGSGYSEAGYGYGGSGYSEAGNGNSYGGAGGGNSYGTGGYPGDGYTGGINGYAAAEDDFADAADGYGGARNGYAATGTVGGYPSALDGYGDAGDSFAGTADTEPGLSDPRLVAPDAGVDPYRWQADQDARREAGRRGLVIGAVTGFLAAAVAIGVSTLAAGFLRPQASPMAALDSVFIDRTPAVLKNVALQHFGTNGRTVLLLGMYAAIAVLAVGIGLLARQAAASGVACLAAFSLLAAFVTITRPGGRVSDVAPAIIGGIAGIAALLWLMRASAPIAPPQRQARGSARRRAG